MAYLLMLGLPWFAGALALGAFVGFLIVSRAQKETLSSGWIALLAAVALITSDLASLVEIFAGREPTTLDIAVVAGLFSASGLPLGRWLGSLGMKAEKKPPAPEPIIVAPAAALAPEPSVLPIEEAALLAAQPVAYAGTLGLDAAPLGAIARANGHARAPEAPTVRFAKADAPATVESAPAVAAPREGRAKKPAPGVRPQTLGSPRDGGPDDLGRIKGVGPKSLEKLNALGVFHYDQIATWDQDNAKWVGAAIGAPGRVERDRWIEQARVLAAAGTGER